MARILAVLIALAAAPAWACRCDPAGALAIAAHPERARSAFIGVLSKQDSKLVRVQRSWTGEEGVVGIERGSKCALTLAPGKRYLFLSLETPDSLRKRGVGMTVCDTVAKALTESLDEVEALAAHAPPAARRPDPSWYVCGKDPDCAPDTGVCGNLEGVSKRSLAPHGAWVKATAPTVNCMVKHPVKAPGRAYCDDGLCAVR